MKDCFSTFHPIVNFFYFAVVILFSMFIMHPAFLVISLVCAFIYSIFLNGKRAIKFNFLYMLPLLIFMAIFNPLFNHAGVTILFYLDNGNPITLESIVYGFAAATMFIAVICWFSCYNAVVTSDKFIYLFGRIVPALSLIFSMVLRFVPKYKSQIKIISNAQKCIGRDFSNGKLLEKIKNGLKIISIMITWALENAIETADSMKSRGYGLKDRSSFSLFRFDNRDKLILSLMLALVIFILCGFFLGGFDVTYFPVIEFSPFSPFNICLNIAYATFCLLPLIIDIMEAQRWKYLKSKI